MPGGPNPERVFDAAQQLLAAVVTRHGGTLPARQYVSAGPPAWDCELVSVHATGGGSYDGNLSAVAVEQNQRGAGFAMEQAQFGITIVRCAAVAQGTKPPYPTVAQEEDAAAALYADVQRVKNALVAAAKAGELPGCASLVFEGWSVIGPEGKFVSSERLVRVGLVMG